MREQINKVEVYLKNYRDFFGFEPSLQEASDSLLITEEEYLRICRAMFNFESINKLTLENGELNLQVFLPWSQDESILDPFVVVNWSLFIDELSIALGCLDKREEGIISMRYGIGVEYPMTLEEIGKVYGVTRERIRQIETKAMSKLRSSAHILSLRDSIYARDFETDHFAFEDLDTPE